MDESTSKEVDFMLDNALRLPARGGSTRIRSFNGNTRRTSDWDGLRKVCPMLSLPGRNYQSD